MQKHNFGEILKNHAPVEAKLIFSRFRGFEFWKILSKMLWKIVCFLEWRFATVLGGFWKARNLDFRMFFDVFSKQTSKCVLEAKKVEKKRPPGDRRKFFGSAWRNARPSGERKREGSEALRCRRYRKELGEAELAKILQFRSSTPCTTFGGRRI